MCWLPLRPLGPWACRETQSAPAWNRSPADMSKVPGRFNLLEINGATVIVDYGHNTSALEALIEAVELFPNHRRIAVYSAAGDRRDSDMIRQGEMLGDAFDQRDPLRGSLPARPG